MKQTVRSIFFESTQLLSYTNANLFLTLYTYPVTSFEQIIFLSAERKQPTASTNT